MFVYTVKRIETYDFPISIVGFAKPPPPKKKTFFNQVTPMP